MGKYDQTRRYFINKPIGRDSLHCICRDLTVIAPGFERVLLQTVDLFRGEQSGSMVKLWQNCADIS